MGSSYSIHPAKPNDAAELSRLYRHLIPDEPPAALDVAQQRIRDLGRYDGSCILLAERDGALVGAVTLIVVPNMTRQGAPYAFIENVVTHRNYRRHGVGLALLQSAEARAWDAGCYRVMIVSGDHNVEAHAFYEKAGFLGTKTGFQKRRIPDRPIS